MARQSYRASKGDSMGVFLEMVVAGQVQTNVAPQSLFSSLSPFLVLYRFIFSSTHCYRRHLIIAPVSHPRSCHFTLPVLHQVDKLAVMAKADRNPSGSQLLTLLSQDFASEHGRCVLLKNAFALVLFLPPPLPPPLTSPFPSPPPSFIFLV